MKKLLFLLSAAVFLFAACENTPQSPIVMKTEEKDGVKTEYEMDTVKGVKHGIYKMYHPDGKTVSIERQYKNDTLVGTEKLYYENGKIKSEASYVDGKFDGPFKEYFEDGKIKQEGTYKADAIEGELKTYYPNGKLKEKVTMLANLENGPFEQYHENGSILAKGTFKHDGNKAQEYCLLEIYKEDGSGVLEKKMICNGKGGYCTIWKTEEGDVEPSSDLCAEIIEKMKEECGQEG
jgi:antitoxin component YwqK of YwqJK toxin-antitoxin module